MLLWAWLSVAAVASAQRQACLDAHAESQRLRIAGALVAAREQLLGCAQPECPQLVAGECTTWLAEVDAALPSVVFAVTGRDGVDLIEVRIESDGALLCERADGRAQPIDPGVHEFRFEAAGYEPQVLTLPIRQSERNRIVRVQLATLRDAGPTPGTERDPAEAQRASDASGSDSAGIPTASYVLAGVSLAGFAAFGYFAIDGASRYDLAQHGCAPACTPEQVAAGKRAYLVADVALGVGVASAAAALLVHLLSSSDGAPDTEPRARLQPALLPRGAGLRWTARY